jgi:hypothetical protein
MLAKRHVVGPSACITLQSHNVTQWEARSGGEVMMQRGIHHHAVVVFAPLRTVTYISVIRSSELFNRDQGDKYQED